MKEARQFIETYLTAFPDVRLAIGQMVSEGDLVAVECNYSGTNRGSLRGVPATGKHVTCKVMALLTISNGKIAQEISAWDRLSVFEQLGLSPEATKRMARNAGGN